LAFNFCSILLQVVSLVSQSLGKRESAFLRSSHAVALQRDIRWGARWGAGVKNILTAIQIRKAEPGKLFDGGGLTLDKAGETGKWVFRYSHLGKRREMGLGAWPAVGLAEARAARDRWAAELAAGRDPIATRDAQRAEEIANRDRDDPTFAEATKIVFDSFRARLRGDGTRGHWMSPVTLHVLPKIGPCAAVRAAATPDQDRAGADPVEKAPHRDQVHEPDPHHAARKPPHGLPV
jgi:hypothetical protein